MAPRPGITRSGTPSGGSKRALLRAVSSAAAVASPVPLTPEKWRATIRAELADAVGTDPTASAYLAAASRLFVQVAERTAPYWRMHRQAAATDPEIAAGWLTLTNDRRDTFAEVAEASPSTACARASPQTTSRRRSGRSPARRCTTSSPSIEATDQRH
jgi:hypothetical protein